MALSETKICNLSLSDLGAKRINDLAADSTVNAILCRLHYEPIRDALQRSHSWRFVRDRVELSQDTTDPAFEWDNQFILPNDFLRFRSVFEEEGFSSKHRRHAIEGQRYLTNFDTVQLRYVKKVTDVTKFDPLFVQILVLELELKLVMPLTQDVKLKQTIKEDIKLLMPRVRAVDADETNVGGRSDWNLARHGGLGITGVPERLL